MEKVKIILKVVASLLLTAVIVASVAVLWYFPHYILNTKQVDISRDEGQEITMMSYNLRCLTPLDLGKKSWFYRAELIVEDLRNEHPGIIGFQEATSWQYDYLVQTLKGYDSVITYRDASVIAEGCPIFYDTARYNLVDKGSFWLSETPEVMSKDWGAAHYRICSYVILTDKASGKDFVVFNTHLDHVSDEARIKGIGVVLDKIAAFGGLPAVIMGDFNAEEGSETYISVTEHFLDARYAAEETVDTYTYQNWGDLDNARRIDYFMLSKTGFRVHSYCALTEPYDGIYSSDHSPIVLRVSLN